MWSGTIVKVCIAALSLCACAALRAESLVVEDIADQSLLVPTHIATLPAEVTPRHETSQPLGILTADEVQAESQPVVADAREGWSDNCCCLVPTSKMCPCTYGWADMLILWRDNDATNRPLVINLNTGESLISTGDLGFDAGWGVRAGFGVRDACGCCGWEFGYLGVFGQDAERSVEAADELALPGDLGLATNNFFFADEASVRYESQINGAEINRVCCCCCCDDCCCRSFEWIYGFRYLNVNEDFAITAIDFQESTSVYDVHTNNNLIGGQVGNRVRRSCGRWSWEGVGKVGLFGNAAEQHSDPIVDFPNFVVRPGRTESTGNLAFVGDFNLTAIYQINNVWGARLGYNLIWIEGVALAPDQLDFTNTTTSGSGISTDGGIFLHGLNAGVEARW
jgi:hypothetical protein